MPLLSSGSARRLVVALLCSTVAGGAMPAGAQTPTISACYVPTVGAIYLIKLAGLPTACLSASHVEVVLKDGVSGTAGGDLAGSFPNPSVVKLLGRALAATPPTAGQVLTFDGTSWVPATPAGGSSGIAGGDLSGAYPNPTVARLQGKGVSSAAPSDGQVLSWNAGTNLWQPSTPPSGVSVHGQLSGLAADDHPQYLLGSGARALTGNLSLGGNKLTGLAAGTVAGDAVRFEQAVKVGDAAGGDVGGTFGSLSVTGLRGRGVSSVAPTAGQVLSYDGTSWVPATPAGGTSGIAGGDLSGAYPNPTVARLQGKGVSGTAPTDGQVLSWNAGASLWQPSTPPSGVSVHGQLSGLAADDHPQYLLGSGTRALTGNLALGGNKVTGLAAGTAAGDAVRFEQAVKVGDAAGGDVGGTFGSLSVTGLRGRGVSSTAPTTGQVLSFDGTNWVPATPAGGTSGVAGGDLSGTYPNPTVVKLQGKGVSGTAPTDGQVLSWNAGASLWQPSTPPSGVTAHALLSGLGADDHPQYLLASGTRALAGNLALGGNKLTGLAAGTAAGDAVRYEQAVKTADVAGGDLSGTYPNPKVSGLSGNFVAPMVPSNGNVLTWVAANTRWEPQPPAAVSLAHNQLTGLMTDDHPQYLLTNGARATVNGFAVTGGLSGTIPASGAGTRLMWHSTKAAFRAGAIDDTRWDDASTGDYSVALGRNPLASGRAAISLGELTQADGQNSVALGYGSHAYGRYATALGYGTNAGKTGSTGSLSCFPSTCAETAMGSGTTASGEGSTALGRQSTASGFISTAMGSTTTASDPYSTAMGLGTTASGFNSTAMGYNTIASSFYSTAMGYNTIASSAYSTAMGRETTASGNISTAMGWGTSASGETSTAMGAGTTASGTYSTAMGWETSASGTNSTAMGQHTTATGSNSIAMGSFASTNLQNGSFVYGDVSAGSNVVAASYPNSFVVRAAGGFQFFSNGALTSGVYLGSGAGAWATMSSRSRKHGFRDEDGETVLAKIARLPVQSWSYLSQGDAIRHLGPMAQDFYAAFRLGESDTTITTTDIDGVNLLAVKALEVRTRELRAELATRDAEWRAALQAKDREIADLMSTLGALTQRLEALERIRR